MLAANVGSQGTSPGSAGGALSVEQPKDRLPSNFESDAIADGLWHQAQTVYGAIVRARSRTKERLRTVGITSCYRREGVSTVSAILALAISCQKKVLLIDANLSEPSIQRRFRVSPLPGLVQVMSGENTVGECIQLSPLGVSVVTAGCSSENAHTFLSSDHAFPIIDSLASGFDLVLVDLPAISEDSSALELSSRLDGVVFVVEAERVHRQAAQRTMTRLQQSGAQVIGAIFNKRRDYTPDWLYRVL